VEKTSRLRSRDPVASGVKCGSHGGMNNKMKSWMVSWLSLKTKVEPGLHGSRVMSGDSSSSSTSWCGGLRESDVNSVIFPNFGDSSATPVSSSVAIVHPWPKVSTPSRSSRRFLSVLPFNLQFRGRSHLIPFAFSFSACTIGAGLNGRLPPSPSEFSRSPSPPPPVRTSLRSPRSPLSVPQST
jgi:hypothetical protein